MLKDDPLPRQSLKLSGAEQLYTDSGGGNTVLFLALIKNICKLPFTMSGTAAMSIVNYRVLRQRS